MTIDGISLAAGTCVQLEPFLINRDASRHANPEQFDPSRYARGEPSPAPLGGEPGAELVSSIAKAAFVQMRRIFEEVLAEAEVRGGGRRWDGGCQVAGWQVAGWQVHMCSHMGRVTLGESGRSEAARRRGWQGGYLAGVGAAGWQGGRMAARFW